MPDSPLISIVLPTYNGERFLEQSIRSCLDQTWSPLELIVVDDASTDSTSDIVTRMAGADSRIHILRHEHNRRLPAALNTGFTHARGEFLTWTSDDNYYRPEAIAEMVAVLRDQPDVDVVYADYTVIDEDGTPVRRQKVKEFTALVHRNCIGACFLYRRRVQAVVGNYDERHFVAEDYDFWLRASVRCRMVPLHKDLYGYRDHRASLTQIHADGRGRKAADAALAANLPRLPWLTRTDKAEAFITLARHARWWGANRDVWRYLLRAGFYSPGRLMQFLISRRKENA